MKRTLIGRLVKAYSKFYDLKLRIGWRRPEVPEPKVTRFDTNYPFF